MGGWWTAGRSRAASAALLLLCIWLAWPALTPVHVEGFSASIQSLAMHLAGDDIRRYDGVYPLNLQFFATSRFGMVLTAAAQYALVPNGGEWPMRMAMWASFAGLIASAAVLVRRWAVTTLPWAVVALALIPGFFESAFFYNDGVLSSAFLAGSLVVLTRAAPLSLARGLWAGVLFGLAIVARADALIIGSAVALCLLGVGPQPRASLAAAAAVAVGTLLPVVALPALWHFSLLDTLHVASTVVKLWDRPTSFGTHRQSLLQSVGLPGLLAVPIGIGALVSRRSWRLLVLLVGVPVVYNLIYLGKMWQPRQLLPLVPFFAALIAIGAQAIWRLPSRWPRHLATAFVAVVWLLPPRHAVEQDGPHALLGRIWSPMLWSAWQGAVRGDFDRLESLVRGLPADALLVTDYWDADRYIHLTLQEAGYRIVAKGSAQGDKLCRSNVETFERDGRTVRHLRLHVPFLPDWEVMVPREIARDDDRCPPLPHSVVAYVASSDRLGRVRPGPSASPPAPQGWWLRRIGHNALTWIVLTDWPDGPMTAAARLRADGWRKVFMADGGKKLHPTDEATARALRPVLQGYWTEGASAP